jgi:hypothetical protein
MSPRVSQSKVVLFFLGTDGSVPHGSNYFSGFANSARRIEHTVRGNSCLC